MVVDSVASTVVVAASMVVVASTVVVVASMVVADSMAAAGAGNARILLEKARLLWQAGLFRCP